MPKHLVSIDWLSIFCHVDEPNLEKLNPLFPGLWHFKKLQRGDKNYKNIYEVYMEHDNEVSSPDRNPAPAASYPYATIVTDPHSALLDPLGCVIKLDNRECYRADVMERLRDFLATFGFRYRSISRIDLCCDLQEFDGGLKPVELITGVLSFKYLKNGQPRFTLHGETYEDMLERVADAQMQLAVQHGTKNPARLKALFLENLHEHIRDTGRNHLTIHGRANHVNDFDYLCFGSKTSAVQGKLYDKTRQLMDNTQKDGTINHKPHITQMWEANGITDWREKHVWRVEMSIRPHDLPLLDKQTGELIDISLTNEQLWGRVNEMFYAFADKYFQFRINDGTRNHSRMPLLKLWGDRNNTPLRPKHLHFAKGSNHMDKMMLGRWMRIVYEASYNDPALTAAINYAVWSYAAMCNLNGWVDKERRATGKVKGNSAYDYIRRVEGQICNEFVLSKEALRKLTFNAKYECDVKRAEMERDALRAEPDRYREPFEAMPEWGNLSAAEQSEIRDEVRQRQAKLQRKAEQACDVLRHGSDEMGDGCDPLGEPLGECPF